MEFIFTALSHQYNDTILIHLPLDKMATAFADDIFKYIFLNENIKFSLKFVLKGLINNIPALVQIMAWLWPGVNPLSCDLVKCQGPEMRV